MKPAVLLTAALGALILGAAVLGCDRAPKDTPAPTPTPSAATAPPPAPVARPRVFCRAASLVGAARIVTGPGIGDGGAPLAPALDIPPGSWVEVAAGARLSTRDPKSGRELHFLGAGRVKPCAGDDEEAWVLRGVVESSRGAGEGPGAEEWVVSPYGVVRYATGVLHLESSAYGTGMARIDGGVAFAWTPPGVHFDSRVVAPDGGPPPPAPAAGPKPPRPRPTITGDGWTRMETGVALTFKYDDTRLEPARAKFAADSCTAVAREARRLARLLSSPDGGIGDLAARHVDARRKARAACAVAALRADALPPSSAKEALEVAVREASAEWRALGP